MAVVPVLDNQIANGKAASPRSVNRVEMSGQSVLFIGWIIAQFAFEQVV